MSKNRKHVRRACMSHVQEKLKAHEKLTRHQDEHRDETKQIKVGDKVLLDENDPRIATSEHNTDRATPFTVMNIFPHGTIEVTHIVVRNFKVFPNQHGQAHGRTLGHAHTTGSDTAVRYGRVKTKCGRSERSRTRPCDTAVCTNTPKEHGRGPNSRHAQI
ncbi:hypothetical protein GOBAR_AA35057 [Gossypium barbadense]|uniref:Uncharacterized protein n=1 Tax=Gossypium barbadense TaxID=3634 RepID=A0A2P5W3C7_GOSBA|nr:hypothetical protein GOBAR_AA35057 [Gossypium barbadense]